MDKARELALKIINDVNTNGAYANVSLAKHFRSADARELTQVDRRFVTELVYGTVKAGGTLYWIIKKYVNRPLKKLHPVILDILRLGVYQIKYMDRIPDSAACNEAVELAKRYNRPGAGFVNGVLRTMLREPGKAGFPTGKGNATIGLALSAQHPEWLVRRWIKEFGYDEAEKLCAFNNTSAPLSVRTNTLKISREELKQKLLGTDKAGALMERQSPAQPMGVTESGKCIETETMRSTAPIELTESTLVPEGIIVRSHGSLDALEPLQAGLCQVQDESSMLVAHVLQPQPGEKILDVCSAPGGKTTHIAALMENKGEITALDIYDHKLARVQENAQRLGIDIIKTELLDAREAGGRFPAMFDRVLVDAPCSGLGVLRRKPDSRWRKTPELLKELPVLQLAILQSAAKALKPGGTLVYSTCTIAREENQAVVEKFLVENKEFKLLSAGERLPVKRPEAMVQLYPQRDGTDGFFIACMQHTS